ncbi:MFS transporter [Kribbella koreensis]|uniref:MFS transporter n=1 Tax=Kribbella koreensis TaxID=57909 RepID=A0ABN1QYX1_9ACTN
MDTPAPHRPGLAITAGGTLLALSVFTAPLSIVPSVAAGLQASTIATSWILSSMSLGLAITLLTAGAIGDDFGRRRVFTAGALVLGIGSAVAGLAPNALVFVLGRVLEGIGAAAVIACGLAIISHTSPPGPARARATGIWGASLGAGIALGPLAGSLIDTAADWRYSYLLFTVLALGLALVGRFRLEESRSGRARTIDVIGALLLGVGLACLLAALTEGRQDWTSLLELSLMAGAVVFLTGFVTHQRRASGAMLDLTLFRRPALSAATLAAFISGAGITALLSFFCTVLERGMARSPVFASVLLLSWSAISVAAALLTRHLPPRLSGGAKMAGGLVVITIGLIPMTLLTPTSAPWHLIGGLVVAGVGTGVVNATLAREAVASVPPDRAGTGSGINNTSRYVGAAIGVTVVTIIAVHPAGTPATLVAGWNTATLTGMAFSVVGAAAVYLLHRADTPWMAARELLREGDQEHDQRDNPGQHAEQGLGSRLPAAFGEAE